MGKICIPVTQGFVHIDSNQHNTGQNQNQGSCLPAQDFIKRTFSLCIQGSLTVILRMSVTRSVFACPSGFLYPILMYPALLRPAFCQLLLALFESLPASASAGTPCLAAGRYRFCLIFFFPHAPLPFYVFQQSPHLTLPIYSNPMFLQTCGADTVPLSKGSGKCAVIDLPASAGRAPLL